MPAAFIPVAERNGLIDGIGLWVAREACRQVVAWQAAGYQVPRMSINVSAAQFRHPGLAGLMARLLAEHGLDPSRFVIELTESALMADPESAHQQLRQIKQAGLRVSIDDFRDRALVAVVPAALPAGRAEDRPQLHRRSGAFGRGSLEVLRSILTLSRALDLDIVVDGGRDAGAAGAAARAGLPGGAGLPVQPAGERGSRCALAAARTG